MKAGVHVDGATAGLVSAYISSDDDNAIVKVLKEGSCDSVVKAEVSLEGTYNELCRYILCWWVVPIAYLLVTGQGRRWQ